MSRCVLKLACCVFAAVVVVSAVRAQPTGRPPVPPEVRGTLKAVDATARTLTLGGYEGRGEAAGKTYPLAKDAEVALLVSTSYGRGGVYAPGKLADLLVLDADPLDDIRNTRTIRFVMKNGRLYDANTLDEAWPRQRAAGRFYWASDQ